MLPSARPEFTLALEAVRDYLSIAAEVGRNPWEVGSPPTLHTHAVTHMHCLSHMHTWSGD